MSANAHFAGAFAEKRQPIRIDDFRRMMHETPHHEPIDEQTDGEQNYTNRIDD